MQLIAVADLGIVLAESWVPWDVFRNHVALVWAYELNGDQLTLRTYDCNSPNRDDIAIQLDINSPAPAKPIATNGTAGPTSGHIRGFFRLPYAHVDPSPACVDDAAVTVDVPPAPAMTPQSTTSVRLSARNTGTTTWTAADGYRLGGQRPTDATTWGTHRVELSSSPVDPDESAVFQFDVTAPATAGRRALQQQLSSLERSKRRTAAVRNDTKETIVPAEMRAYTRDEMWRVLLTTWRTNLLVYNAIGATIRAQHWETTKTWLLFDTQGWVDHPVESIHVNAVFEGVLPSTAPGAANRSDSRVNSAEADVRLWSAGVSISADASPGSGLPDPGTVGPGGAPRLDVRNVRATGGATINGEYVQLPEASLL